MEQIIIHNPDGSVTPLAARGNTSGVTSAEQRIALLGEDTVTITVRSAAAISFVLGSYIEIYGKTYKLNQLPTIKKIGSRKLEYTLTFEGAQYDLIDVQFLLPINTKYDNYTGDVDDFLDLLITNANRVYPDCWVKGDFPADSETKTLSYTGNCLETLQNICGEWETEFEITQANGVRTINLRKAGVDFPYTFRYGRGGGLYELTRQNISSKDLVTRLYVYGGTQNISSKYRHTKLCLPTKEKNASYIEDATALAAFGVKENTVIFEDIFPTREGSITAAGSEYYAFVDTTMFDLNEKEADGVTTKWLIEGVAAKVKMTTGNLAGYEFEIHHYDNTTHEIQVVPFTDEAGYKFPRADSAAFQFAVGDKYILTDIVMPDSYVEAAEAALLAKGTASIAESCQPQVQYGLSIDQNFIKQFAGQLTITNLFAVGDNIPVEDSDIGVDRMIRITGFTRDLLQPYKYSLTLADSVAKTTLTRIVSELRDIDTVITLNNLADPSKARRNWRAAQEVLASVFDPDGHYFSDKIKPLSIETTMLATGARSQQLVLQNVRLEPNFEGSENTLKVYGGSLVHYTIADEIISWTLTTNTISNLDSATAYYIYARCEKNGSAGTVLLDTAQRKVDSDTNYYFFLLGTLTSVISDSDEHPARLIGLTYGSTTINGRFINAGRIQSADGITYFDLDNSEIGGKINFVDGLVSGSVGIGNADGVNAGLNGEGNEATNVRIWVGATAANKATAPYRVLHSGKAIMSDAEVTGTINATSGTLNDVIIKGSIKNPFVHYDSDTPWELDSDEQPVSDFNFERYDNIVLTRGSFDETIHLPWTLEHSGRRICLLNYKWGTFETLGTMTITAAAGKYFFEDGIAKSSITFSREMLELIGYGDDTTFFGWIVANRRNLMTEYRYGRSLNALAQGYVTGTSNGATMNYKSFDGSTLSIDRRGVGQYRITFPSTWFSSPNHCIAIVTGFGYSDGSTTSPIKATVTARAATYIDVDTSDDETRNDGSFMFQITNLNDW